MKLAALLLVFLSISAHAESLSRPRFVLPDESGKLDPSILFQPGNIINMGLKNTKELALTFDDGPTAGTTAKVLDVLAKHRVRATFFVNGKNVPGKEALLQRIFSEGHLIASHSTYHNDLSKPAYDNAQTLIDDIAYTHEVIRPYLRSDDMWFFRAPYGAWRSARAVVLNRDDELRNYIGPIFWNIGGEISPNGVQYGAADWDCWGRGYSAASCLTGYVYEARQQGGGVVLMHDVNSRTADLADGFIEQLSALGYKFVRLDEVKALEQYK